MKYKAMISWILIFSLISLFAGCKEKEKITNNKKQSFSGYPMKTDETLTYWLELNKNVSAISPDLGKTPFAEEIKKRTGIGVNYIHPIEGKVDSQLNILMASGDMPDIVEYNWAGSSQKMLKDQYIIPLNDVFDQYSPNLKNVIKNDPEINKMMKTSDGTYYAYPFIRENEMLTILTGPMVRGDWLQELGISEPETIDDWYGMLKQFKENKGATSPFVYEGNIFANGEFCGAYGVIDGFYIENGKVIYGAISQNYKTFLKEFTKWYKEGLIEKNIANLDSKAVDANIINGKSGATVGYAGSGMGKWNSILSEKDPKAILVPVNHPVLNKGERPKFGHKDLRLSIAGTAITTSCKKVELAARYLDYGYSEEGKRFYNFGIEGVSYNMVDGYPKYSDVITKNPKGLTMNEAMGQYLRGNQLGPFMQAKEYLEQYYNSNEQKNALSMWGNTDVDKHYMPMVQFTLEENVEMSNISESIKRYTGEMTLRFIMGIESIDNFDAYVKIIKEMNIDRAIEIYQAAYNRYVSK